MRQLFSIIVILAVMQSAIAQVRYRWEGWFHQGTSGATIKNRLGSYFRLSCGTGHNPSIAGLDYEPKHRKLGRAESVQIVVDGNAFHFDMKRMNFGNPSWSVDFSTSGSRRVLGNLSMALIQSKGNDFQIEFPRINYRESFSLLDAPKTLAFGDESIMEKCL